MFDINKKKKTFQGYLIYGLQLQCGFWDGTCIKDLI